MDTTTITTDLDITLLYDFEFKTDIKPELQNSLLQPATMNFSLVMMLIAH